MPELSRLEGESFISKENIITPNVKIDCLAPDGLGFGDGSISVKKRRESAT